MQVTLAKIKPHLVFTIGLIFLTLFVYGQTFGFDFLSNWDDYQYVTNNPDIRGVTAKNLIAVFSSHYLGNYAPIHLLSYMFDYQVAGLNPAWFHGVNLVVHIANGLLFYLLVYRLTGKPFWAFVSSSVFLLHPAQVESVAWVSERKNLLAMFFSLCSFLSYIAYRRQTGERRHAAYVFSTIFLILALLAKSIAVIMPFVFLLHDVFLETPVRRKNLFVDKIFYVVVAAVAAGITLVTQSVEMGGGSVDFFDGNSTAKIFTMLPVLTRYMQTLVWPSNLDLNSVYIFYIKYRIDRDVVVALLLVLTLSIAGIYLLRRDRRLFFGFSLFFLGLVPVSQIVPLATLMNDRYLYFPMLGAAWILGGLLSRCNDAFTQNKINPALVLIACILIPCTLVSRERTAVWKNAITLWSDVVKKLPTLKDQRAALAAAYLYAGQKTKALETYEELFALKRNFSDPLAEQKALLQTATLYMDAGASEKALPFLSALTTKFPGYAWGFQKLGDYHDRLRNLPEAEKAYHRALALAPDSLPTLIALGNICMKTGKVDEARTYFLTAYEKGGNGPYLQYLLAGVEARAQHHEKSLQYLAEALRLGYRDLDAITSNTDLASIRQLPSFARLISNYFGGKD
ncbi:O-GlcNAc transferase [Geobacter sp. AOG2]|nr:O-GlcNAc transferase [Geobacter sp. AOG2]